MVAPIGRIQASGSGFAGAPGLMNFYWNGAVPGIFDAADATAAIAAVRQFLYANSLCIANNAAWQVEPNVEVFEALDGGIISTVTGTPVASVAGTGAGSTLTAEGPLMQWFTNLVVGRRALRGRTFFVPSASGAVDALGRVSTARVAAAIAAGNAYLATSPQKPVIWHRPVPFATGANGVASVITACNMSTTVAVLRSRRD